MSIESAGQQPGGHQGRPDALESNPMLKPSVRLDVIRTSFDTRSTGDLRPERAHRYLAFRITNEILSQRRELEQVSHYSPGARRFDQVFAITLDLVTPLSLAALHVAHVLMDDGFSGSCEALLTTSRLLAE